MNKEAKKRSLQQSYKKCTDFGVNIMNFVLTNYSIYVFYITVICGASHTEN